VALTDFALAIECMIFVAILSAMGKWGVPFKTGFIFFFTCNAFASFFGGMMHGYFPDRQRGPGGIFWRGALISVGASTIAIWAIGTQLIFSADISNYATVVAFSAFLLYTVFLFSRVPPFSWAVIFYLPSALFMTVAFLIAYIRAGELEILYGLTGAFLTLVAALIQRRKIGLHSQYFNHNALYHVVQGVAFFMVFLAARQMIRY